MLGCVLAFEARQKYSYDPTVTQLRKVFSEDTEKYVKLSEIQKMISGSPTRVTAPHERKAYNTIDLKWPSLFKDYRVQLIVERDGADPLVAGFTTPGGTDPEPVAKPGNSSATATASVNPTMPPGMSGMMPMMGPPGGPGGPGGRPARPADRVRKWRAVPPAVVRRVDEVCSGWLNARESLRNSS